VSQECPKARFTVLRSAPQVSSRWRRSAPKQGLQCSEVPHRCPKGVPGVPHSAHRCPQGCPASAPQVPQGRPRSAPKQGLQCSRVALKFGLYYTLARDSCKHGELRKNRVEKSCEKIVRKNRVEKSCGKIVWKNRAKNREEKSWEKSWEKSCEKIVRKNRVEKSCEKIVRKKPPRPPATQPPGPLGFSYFSYFVVCFFVFFHEFFHEFFSSKAGKTTTGRKGFLGRFRGKRGSRRAFSRSRPWS